MTSDKPDLRSVKSESPNPFDPAALRLDQSFAESAGVKKLITTVPVRKPNPQDFIRVRSGEDWRVQTAVIELKEDRETYLVSKDMWAELPGDIVPVSLFTTITRQGVLSLWPVKLPGDDGRWNEWNRSALDAAEHATTRWIRIAANMSLGAYEVYEATGNLPEPEWPDLEFDKILEIAFRDRFVTAPDHPVVKRLQGAV